MKVGTEKNPNLYIAGWKINTALDYHHGLLTPCFGRTSWREGSFLRKSSVYMWRTRRVRELRFKARQKKCVKLIIDGVEIRKSP